MAIGQQHFIKSVFTHAEAMRFRIHGVKTKRDPNSWEDKFDPLPFPRTYGERKTYIFSHTGHAAKPMDWREWYCFNYAMNQGLDIGLAADGSDRTLMMLSLIDHALSQPPRFVGMAQMPPMRADSTTAHSKQSMNLGQTMFERRKLYFQGELKPEYNAFRREAMLGFWVHDMGECIFEIVTASDRFGLSKEENAWLTERKNEVEAKVFTFACQLAIHWIEQGKPQEFIETIHHLRQQVLEAKPIIQSGENPKLALLRARLEVMENGMAEVESTPGFPRELATETKHILDIYERTEKSGTFLHNFVKTLEGVEGQRYLQRNSAETPTDYWSRQLHDEAQYPVRPTYDLTSDYDIVMSIHRAERRLPDLFATATTHWERELAKQTAAFVYGSIARQFTPAHGEYVALAPEIVDRNPTPPASPEQLTTSELKVLRESELGVKRERHAAQSSDDLNAQFYSRSRAGALYRAAEHLVCDGFSRNGFIPTGACLLRLADTPEIPPELVQKMNAVEQGNIESVVQIRRR